MRKIVLLAFYALLDFADDAEVTLTLLSLALLPYMQGNEQVQSLVKVAGNAEFVKVLLQSAKCCLDKKLF